MKYILEFLQEYPPELQETWIDKILDKVQRQRLMDTLIRIDCMELAVKVFNYCTIKINHLKYLI